MWIVGHPREAERTQARLDLAPDRGQAGDLVGTDLDAGRALVVPDADDAEPGLGQNVLGGLDAAELLEDHPEAVYHERARILTVGRGEPRPGAITVLAAGTSDLGVAEEAAVCASWFGHEVERCYDVGVAGIHRLLGNLPAIRQADVVVAVAGMDGALPTVVAGLVPAPVVAVPTSVGYGASFGGLAALLTMLNGCAPGIGVVNIDNGYGAAVLASRIARSKSMASP